MLSALRSCAFLHTPGNFYRVVAVALLVIILVQPAQPAQAAARHMPVKSELIEPFTQRLALPLVLTASTPPAGQRFVIGYSVASRPLEVYRYGWGERKKMIVAAIHGGYEWNTMELAKMLMAHLMDHPELIPSDQTLYILPLLNPDGETRSHWIEGRANEHGADINRNFDANWKSDWYRVGCWNSLPITAGTGPFSEPEAAALRDFVLANQIEALISYHSSGHEIYAGGVPPDADSLSLALALEHASGYDYPPHSSPCEMTGQLIDWASAQGIAAVDIELTYHQEVDYEPNELILEAFLQWSKGQ